MKILWIIFAAIAVFAVIAAIYLQHPKFGPSASLILNDRIKASANFHEGEFRNQIDTPLFTTNTSTFEIIFKTLTEKSPADLFPDRLIPTQKVNLKALDRQQDLVIWLGHSSFYTQIAGKRILIDPVFSSYASPLPIIGKAFQGSNLYQADDMPELDLLLITHSHWDHLDYDSVTALEPKTRRVVTGLGVDAYLRQWGYPKHKLQSLDWNEETDLGEGLTVHALPARHYTRRLFRSNQTLWVSYALIAKHRQLYFGGDSGYGPHFADIGNRFGSFDFVALDCGQYSERWKYIHMTPEQAAQAATELHGSALLPQHIGRFSISDHAWYEPFYRIQDASKDQPFQLLTPVIGEVLKLDALPPEFTEWWKSGV